MQNIGYDYSEMVTNLIKFRSSQSGFSLIELMVGLGLSGVVFAVLMTLLGQTAKFASFFGGTATGVEGTAEAVTMLNTVMPQIVRVRSCACRGLETAPGNSYLSNCVWRETEPWFNPILNGTGSNSSNGNLGVMVLDADYEDFWGGTNDNGTSQLRFDFPATGISQLYNSYTNNLGACQDYDSVPNVEKRGCKRRLRLFFNAPTMEVSGSSSTADASVAGRLTIIIGGDDGVSESTAPSSALSVSRIGDRAINGSTGLGLTEFSCGFLGSTGGISGLNFVMNLKLKARSTSIQTPSHNNYESWYPNTGDANSYAGSSGKNYNSGLFRDLRLKYSFRNIGTRGLHHWRSQSNVKCKANGAAAGAREQCCSFAIASGTCTACLASGEASADADRCCSEKVLAGDCI